MLKAEIHQDWREIIWACIQRGTLDVRCKEFVEYSREIYIYIDRNINTNIHETTILVTPTLI